MFRAPLLSPSNTLPQLPPTSKQLTATQFQVQPTAVPTSFRGVRLLRLHHTAPWILAWLGMQSLSKAVVRPRQHGSSRLAANLPLASTHHLGAFKLRNQRRSDSFHKATCCSACVVRPPGSLSSGDWCFNADSLCFSAPWLTSLCKTALTVTEDKLDCSHFCGIQRYCAVSSIHFLNALCVYKWIACVFFCSPYPSLIIQSLCFLQPNL